jgi:ABC-type transporter Mla maintaining outer membrane lipid asymmetry ATPase subunit MlaF
VNILHITGVTRQYGALRPLRIASLTVQEGEQVALVGLDQPAAEVFISLVTGAALPDSGTVEAFGRGTSDIADSSDWLATLDRFGIVSDRAALIDQFSVAQNLAIPFSLEIVPPPPSIYAQARALALEAGLPSETVDAAVRELTPAQRVRVRFARALALGPSLLLMEHPSATLPPQDARAVARDLRRVLEARRIAAITLTMDPGYAAAAASRVLTLAPATGTLKESRGGRFRFWK